MTRLTAAATLLNLALFAAHALRHGDHGTAASLVLLAGLCLSRRAWLRPVLFTAMGLAAFVWTDTALDLFRLRQALGQDWLRPTLILGAAAGLNLAGMLLAASDRGRAFFNRNEENAAARAALFLATTGTLVLIRAKVPFPILLADRYAPGWGMLEITGLGLYAALVGGAMLDPARARSIRPRIWALFSLVFFLQLVLGLSGMERMLMTGAPHLPVPALIVGGPLYRGHGLFMPVLFVCAVLLAGPAWCSHLCYIGAWDDALSRSRGVRPGRDLGKLPFFGRLGTLALTVGAALGLRAMGASTATALGLGAGFGLLGAGVMATLSRRTGVMVHCNAFCPMGLLGNLLGRLAPWRMRMNADCTGCGRCAKACRYSALSRTDIGKRRPGLSCTLCGDCVAACPHRAMEYRAPGLSPGAARTAFLVVVVVLHAVFLGVARI